MKHQVDDIAERFLGTSYDTLDERTKRVTRHIAERKHISRNTPKEATDNSTFGQRAAEAVATFGGSWVFIMLFTATLVIWVGLNSFVLCYVDPTALGCSKIKAQSHGG